MSDCHCDSDLNGYIVSNNNVNYYLCTVAKLISLMRAKDWNLSGHGPVE